MNKDKRPIIFSKVKRFASHRKKELRFNLNPHLDREECLKDDLKLLKLIHYDPPKPQESEVVCESFLTDISPEILVLTEADVWRFVFSEDWAGFSSLRICEGRLLDTVLYVLHSLVSQGTLRTYKQAKFEGVDRQQARPQNENKSKNTVPAKIKFTYYALDCKVDVKEIKLKTYPLKRREVLTHKRELSAVQSHFSSYSEVSLVSSSECGDSVQSVEKQASQSSRKLSEGDLTLESEVDITPSKCDPDSMSTKSHSIHNVSDKSFTADSTHTMHQVSHEGTCTPDETDRVPSQTTGDKVTSDYRNSTTVPHEDNIPTETASGSVLDGHKPSGENLSAAISLQTTIGSVSASFSKRTDLTKKSFVQGSRKDPLSPEPILTSIVFETDYDTQKKKKVSKISSSRSMNHDKIIEMSPRKPSRPYLTDPEEHVILPDEDDQVYSQFSTTLSNVQHSFVEKCDPELSCQNNTIVSRETSPYENPPQDSFWKHGNNFAQKKGLLHPAKLQHEVVGKQSNFTECHENSVYLKIIENQSNANKHAASQGETSQPDTCSDDKSSIADKKVSKKVQPFGKTKGKRQKRGCNRQKLFNDIISNYSVKLFKQKKKFESIKMGIPVNENKEKIIQMMENFLEEKYLPKLNKPKEKPFKPIKLAPLVNAPKPTVASLLGQIHHNDSNGQFDHENFFPQRMPGDFIQRLSKACQDFLVRKEQVTLSNCWQTLTSVTINRKQPNNQFI